MPIRFTKNGKQVPRSWALFGTMHCSAVKGFMAIPGGNPDRSKPAWIRTGTAFPLSIIILDIRHQLPLASQILEMD